MNPLFYELNNRKQYLQDLMKEIECKQGTLPSGTLRVSKINGVPRFYHMTKTGDTKGKYIQKKNKGLACQLAQKDYMQQLYREAERELKSINLYLENHGEADLENVYEGLLPYRKEIYHEHLGLLDNEEYRLANLQKLEEYRKNGIYPGKNLILTYEAEGCYLNIKEVKHMIQELFIR